MTTTAPYATSARLPGALAQNIVNEWKQPILILDRNLLMMFANRAFCRWLEVEWAKMEGRPFVEFLDNTEVATWLREVNTGSIVRDLQVNGVIPPLGNRSLSLSANLLAGKEGILVAIVDITEQQRENTVLSRKMQVAQSGEIWERKQADLLRSIMDSTGDGVFVTDASGASSLWNPACERILGTKPEHQAHAEWAEGVGVYLPDKVTRYPLQDLPLARALRGESCDDVELWIKNEFRPEGFWISVTSRPLTGGQDGAVSTFRDITSAKTVDETLAQKAEEVTRSNRELEQFAYVAAHDLQEPLRMVSSYVQLLARRYKGKLDAEADEFIGFATEGAKRMSLLINDLLSFSRIGRGEVKEEIVDCEKVLEHVLRALANKNLAARAEVTHDPLPQIKANELQITQVLQNLIDNAVKFRGNENPRVHISAHKEDDKWIFSVADNGIGIDADYKDRIFVIFQRLNTREEYDGTGIGLAVCKKIVEKRDGNIWVEPNQTQGTVVYFTWP